jgi:hypothetical protein
MIGILVPTVQFWLLDYIHQGVTEAVVLVFINSALSGFSLLQFSFANSFKNLSLCFEVSKSLFAVEKIQQLKNVQTNFFSYTSKKDQSAK